MAADDKDDDEDKAKPGFQPKAVHIGGESLADRVLPHIKKILVMFILAAVVISAILVVRWRKHVKQEDATARLTAVFEVARARVDQNAKPEDKNVFKSVSDRANAILDAMATNDATGSPSYKGSVQLDAGKYDDAIATFQSGANKKGIEGVLCREGIGLALEAKATAEKDPKARQTLFEQALTAFTDMQTDEEGPRRAHALYHVGRIQLTLGKKAEAKASFEKAKPLAQAAEPQSPEPQINHYQLAELIERRLAAM